MGRKFLGRYKEQVQEGAYYTGTRQEEMQENLGFAPCVGMGFVGVAALFVLMSRGGPLNSNNDAPAGGVVTVAVGLFVGFCLAAFLLGIIAIAET